MHRESIDWCAPQQRRRSTASESNPKSALSRVVGLGLESGVRTRALGLGLGLGSYVVGLGLGSTGFGLGLEQPGECREHRRCEAGGVEGVELLYKVRVRVRVRMRVVRVRRR